MTSRVPERGGENRSSLVSFLILSSGKERFKTGEEKMNRKIIIKREDLNWEIYVFLKEVGEGIPVDWDTEAFGFVRNAIIRAFERMGTRIEVDERIAGMD